MGNKTLCWGQEPLTAIPAVAGLTVSQPLPEPPLSQPSLILLSLQEAGTLKDHSSKRPDSLLIPHPHHVYPVPHLKLSYSSFLSSQSSCLSPKFPFSSYAFSLALSSLQASLIGPLPFLPTFPFTPLFPSSAFLSPLPDKTGAHTCLAQRCFISGGIQGKTHSYSLAPFAHHPHPDTPWTPMLGLTQIPRPMMEYTCKDIHLPPGTQKILFMQPHLHTQETDRR